MAITTCQEKIEYHGKCDLDISVRYILIHFPLLMLQVWMNCPKYIIMENGKDLNCNNSIYEI